MSAVVAAMEHQKTPWIKHEEADEMHLIPRSMFLKDPLAIENSYCIKEEADLKPGLAVTKADFLEDPLGILETNDGINEEAELKFSLDAATNNLLDERSRISWSTDCIKKDPELNVEGIEAENIMLPSAGYASISVRLIENCGQSCSISFEDTVHGGADSTKHGTQTQSVSPPEDNLVSTRSLCSLEERELCKYICSLCPNSFSSKYELIMHVFVHLDGVQPPLYVCRLCGKVFPSADCLHKHLDWNDSDICGGNNEIFDSSDDAGNVNFLEGDQDINVTEQTDNQPSMRETCSPAGKVQGDVQFAKKPYKCDICGKCFTVVSKLKRHIFIHTGIKPHKCDICDKYFSRLNSLKHHILVHTGLKPHRCDICGKCFNHLGSLKMHTFTHSEMKKHKCDICGKSFSLLRYLKIHALTHTGMKPHKCKSCGKSFTQLINLKSHTFIHTEMKPHKCYICGKSFTQLGGLKRHTLTHNGMKPHKCEICGKSFAVLSYLKRHSFIHTGIKPHKCHICTKSFTLSGYLKRHAVTHTEMMPH